MPVYDSEHIIQYLTNELPPAEREAFDAELARDPELASETARCLEMLGVLEERLPADAGSDALKETFAGMRRKYFTDSDRPVFQLPGAKRRVMIPRSTIRLISGVAAALILVVAGFWFFRGDRATFDELGRTEMVTSLERGDHSDSVMEGAAESFNAGRFRQALPLLDEAVKTDSSSQLARFYRGVTQWHLKNLPAGRADLEAVYGSGSTLQYEAAFYLALSYAQEKNTPSAILWLNRIPDDAPVAPKAKKLRQLLKPAR